MECWPGSIPLLNASPATATAMTAAAPIAHRHARALGRPVSTRHTVCSSPPERALQHAGMRRTRARDRSNSKAPRRRKFLSQISRNQRLKIFTAPQRCGAEVSRSTGSGNRFPHPFAGLDDNLVITGSFEFPTANGRILILHGLSPWVPVNRYAQAPCGAVADVRWTM